MEESRDKTAEESRAGDTKGMSVARAVSNVPDHELEDVLELLEKERSTGGIKFTDHELALYDAWASDQLYLFPAAGVKKFGHLFNRKKNEANNLRRQVLVLSIAKWNPRYISEFLDSEHMADYEELL